MVCPGAQVVLGDMNTAKPGLAVVDRGVAIGEGGAAGTQGLHLGAHEHQAGLEDVLDRVVVTSLLVLGNEGAPLLTWHHSHRLSDRSYSVV